LTATNTRPFTYANVRRTFWYAEEQLQNILAPYLHHEVLTPDVFAEIDADVEGFMTGVMEPAGMVVGLGGTKPARGVAWDWKADGTTTPQSVLDEGGLIAKFGLKVPRALARIDVTLSEFTAPAVAETSATAAVTTGSGGK
ncbi:MAG TPA: hypothetical protein VHN99_07865, partial [Deinococcales bacterium]|nr:hypothetical protein [Deinococcales bacterium]